MQTGTRPLSPRIVACAALGLIAAAAWAQPADSPPPSAPASQPAGQRPLRPDGQPGQDGRRPEGRGGAGEINSVESAMKSINRGVRRLRNQIEDPEKKEDNLKIVGDIEKAIVAAKSMPVPAARQGGPGRGPGGRGGEGGEGGREQPGGPLKDDQNEAPKDAQPKDDAKPKPDAAPDPKRTEEYRRELVKLLRQVIDIEQALIDGKFDQAKADLAKVGEIRDEAHKELGVRQGRD